MPSLGIFLREGESLALLRDDMDDDGMLRILDLGKDTDQLLCVVAVRDEAVIEVHRAKEVVGGAAARLAQGAELLVHAAVVLRD